MAKTITIKGNNPLSEEQRAETLQYMANHLTDDELNKLYQLAKSNKSRQALKNNWHIIKSAFI